MSELKATSALKGDKRMKQWELHGRLEFQQRKNKKVKYGVGNKNCTEKIWPCEEHFKGENSKIGTAK